MDRIIVSRHPATVLQAAFDRFFAIADECDRNGRVNVRDWDADGNPIGGSLTWAAVGEINSARWRLSEEINLDYDFLLSIGL